MAVIVNGQRAVAADTVLRLARFFEISAEFWMRPQMRHDLDVAQDELGDRLEKDVLAKEDVLP